MSALGRRLAAEFIGTFWLVLGGCGSAVLAAAFPGVGIGLLGVALAFGLTVLTMAYAFGHVSGGHFNPAVTLGLWIGGRFNARDVLPYIVTQVVAGIAAAGVLLAIANGKPSYSLKADGLAANGYGKHSPGGYGLGSALLTEILMTAVFLIVILAVTGRGAPVGFGRLAIGLALTLIHLVGIPVTNASVDPAPSTGPAIFVHGWALNQLWLFWLAPLVGAAIAGFSFRYIFEDGRRSPPKRVGPRDPRSPEPARSDPAPPAGGRFSGELAMGLRQVPRRVVSSGKQPLLLDVLIRVDEQVSAVHPHQHAHDQGPVEMVARQRLGRRRPPASRVVRGAAHARHRRRHLRHQHRPSLA